MEMTPFAVALSTISWVHWLLAGAALILALWIGRSWVQKALLALPVIVVFALSPGTVARHAWNATNRLDASMALFHERCKTAGETIKRTVDNVDGIVWMKWREEYSNRDNFADQWKLNDPYGRDCGLESCIGALLRITEGATRDPAEVKRHRGGYRFVETTDPRDGKAYRYRAVIGVTHRRTPEQMEQYRKNTGQEPGPDVYGYVLDRAPISAYSARYGAVWDDISTHEDREHWIAGSSLKVVDLQTNEVIAERVGYMIDRGQGSQAGGRSPWLFAKYMACPAFDLSESKSPILASRSRAFTYKVLQANRAE